MSERPSKLPPVYPTLRERLSGQASPSVKNEPVARERKDNPVLSVVLTGGSCGGKSSGMAYLVEQLQDHGYHPLVVPEAATLLISGGLLSLIQAAEREPKAYFEFQRTLLRLQRDLRARFREAAQVIKKPVVILHDRGEQDNLGFLTLAQWERLMREEGLSLLETRDSYDLVIHLVTAAQGAEHAYTLENNPARYETAEQARASDQRLMRAWLGHPHYRVIDNSTDFPAKMERTWAAVASALGLPVPMERERKYLLRALPDEEVLAGGQAIQIRQSYLRGEGRTERRVRMREQDGHRTYFYTEKRATALAAERHETERLISEREYQSLLTQADPEKKEIRKTRYCLALEGRHWELDLFHSPASLVLAEVEYDQEGEQILLPARLKELVIREVTEEPAYSNARLAAG